MQEDSARWNERYAHPGLYHGAGPSSFLAGRIAFLSALTPGRSALDLACGEGRNSIFLARHGYTVTGLDISDEGLAKANRRAAEEGLAIAFRRVDLEEYEFDESWDLIINFNFLLRDLIPKMVAALNPRGVIVFDTILDTPSLVGTHNPAFLLRPGELRQIFNRFPGTILHDEECPDGPAPTARLIFQSPS
jgi:2-polyprenyl-3-methyl-5-hydroxy-6-metoxy-1,4-benzoquinol methylase